MSVEARIEGIWGDALRAGPGVLHVAAIGTDRDGRPCVVRIGPEAPRSSTDAFALSVARARSDAILTTGRILRSEPDLRYALPPEIGSWRSRALGKARTPRVVVLSRTLDLPWEHPALPRDAILVTEGGGSGAPPPIPPGFGGEVLRLPDSSVRGAIEALQARGFADVCVEAGPSSSSALYDAPVVVDELLLSVYAEEALVADLVAGPFSSWPDLERAFGEARSDVSRIEESGRWRFLRYCRPRSGDAP